MYVKHLNKKYKNTEIMDKNLIKKYNFPNSSPEWPWRFLDKNLEMADCSFLSPKIAWNSAVMLGQSFVTGFPEGKWSLIFAHAGTSFEEFCIGLNLNILEEKLLRLDYCKD